MTDSALLLAILSLRITCDFELVSSSRSWGVCGRCLICIVFGRTRLRDP